MSKLLAIPFLVKLYSHTVVHRDFSFESRLFESEKTETSENVRDRHEYVSFIKLDILLDFLVKFLKKFSIFVVECKVRLGRGVNLTT